MANTGFSGYEKQQNVEEDENKEKIKFWKKSSAHQRDPIRPEYRMHWENGIIPYQLSPYSNYGR